MTQQLSPAARAVSYAYDNAPEKETDNHRYHWLAAALRAAADQVVPTTVDPRLGTVRSDLMRIADELEAL
jgi:hypothetical protein